MALNIPKNIWQTYELPFDQLEENIKESARTWQDLNPDWKYNYMDAKQREEFVLSEFGQDWYDIFVSCPLGVMRADIWRYMIVYTYGGVYADLDALCKAPIEDWWKDEYNLIVGPENNTHFLNWVFAGKPKNSVLKNVLDTIKENFKNPDYSDVHFVHRLTSPGAFTKGIKSLLEIPEETALVDDYNEYMSLPKVIEHKFFCYGNEDKHIFQDQKVHHVYGSQNWNKGYVKWIDHTEEVVKVYKEKQ